MTPTESKSAKGDDRKGVKENEDEEPTSQSHSEGQGDQNSADKQTTASAGKLNCPYRLFSKVF